MLLYNAADGAATMKRATTTTSALAATMQRSNTDQAAAQHSPKDGSLSNLSDAVRWMYQGDICFAAQRLRPSEVIMKCSVCLQSRQRRRRRRHHHHHHHEFHHCKSTAEMRLACAVGRPSVRLSVRLCARPSADVSACLLFRLVADSFEQALSFFCPTSS